MSGRVQDKVAIITGAGRGQGRAHAVRLAGEGAHIVAVQVDPVGVLNTVQAALPHLPDCASLILTGSTAGLMGGTTDNPAMGPGGAGYSFAKQTLVPLVEQLALHLAPRFIRVNAVHPTNCNTHLLHHENLYRVFRPDLENPTQEDAEPAFTTFQAMPSPYIEPKDMADLVLFLASDSKYITGHQIRVDAGSLLQIPGSHR